MIGYYQWNMKVQPTRLPQGSYTYDSIGPTTRQESPSWVWKGEWNGTLSDKLYRRSALRRLRLLRHRLKNSDEDYFWRDTGRLILTGAHAESQNDRDRKQLTGAATYFLDTKTGSHTFKFGGEVYLESQWGGRTQNVGGNIEHIYNNGVGELRWCSAFRRRCRSAGSRRATTATCSSSTSSISRTSSSTTRGRWAA